MPMSPPADSEPKYKIRRDTPWGRIIISYMQTYRCSWNEFARLIRCVHPWLRDFDAKKLRQIVLDGKMPNYPEGLAIAYVCGVKNGFNLLPRTYDFEGMRSAWSNYWNYLKLAKPEMEAMPSPEDAVVKVWAATDMIEQAKNKQAKSGRKKSDKKPSQTNDSGSVPAQIKKTGRTGLTPRVYINRKPSPPTPQRTEPRFRLHRRSVKK